MADDKKLETIRGIFDETVGRMKSLGVYREEYDGTIHIYAQLCEQYLTLTDRFERSKYKIQTQSAQGGMKKAPIVAALEALRKDLLAYSDRLCLNPKSYDAMSMKAAPAKTRLEAAMEAFGSG